MSASVRGNVGAWVKKAVIPEIAAKVQLSGIHGGYIINSPLFSWFSL
jgi:hypothetical protein